MKIRPFICATSTRRSVRRAISLAASSVSSGMPRSRAKWLSVPSGRMPSAVLVPASADAAAAMVPSPPPTTSRGLPRSAIARQRTSHLPLSISSISGSMPAAASALATLSPIPSSATTALALQLRRTGTRAMPAPTANAAAYFPAVAVLALISSPVHTPTRCASECERTFIPPSPPLTSIAMVAS